MDKTEAIRLLGGTATAAARAVGISPQAVTDWPPVLPPRIADRVQAALYRRMTAEQGAGDRHSAAQTCGEQRAA